MGLGSRDISIPFSFPRSPSHLPFPDIDAFVEPPRKKRGMKEKLSTPNLAQLLREEKFIQHQNDLPDSRPYARPGIMKKAATYDESSVRVKAISSPPSLYSSSSLSLPKRSAPPELNTTSPSTIQSPPTVASNRLAPRRRRISSPLVVHPPLAACNVESESPAPMPVPAPAPVKPLGKRQLLKKFLSLQDLRGRAKRARPSLPPPPLPQQLPQEDISEPTERTPRNSSGSPSPQQNLLPDVSAISLVPSSSSVSTDGQTFIDSPPASFSSSYPGKGSNYTSSSLTALSFDSIYGSNDAAGGGGGGGFDFGGLFSSSDLSLPIPSPPLSPIENGWSTQKQIFHFQVDGDFPENTIPPPLFLPLPYDIHHPKSPYQNPNGVGTLTPLITSLVFDPETSSYSSSASSLSESLEGITSFPIPIPIPIPFHRGDDDEEEEDPTLRIKLLGPFSKDNNFLIKVYKNLITFLELRLKVEQKIRTGLGIELEKDWVLCYSVFEKRKRGFNRKLNVSNMDRNRTGSESEIGSANGSFSSGSTTSSRTRTGSFSTMTSMTTISSRASTFVNIVDETEFQTVKTNWIDKVTIAIKLGGKLLVD